MRELVGRVGRLQRLAVFEAAARLGSFTAAARELGTTQPAVTRQIRALEASLGAELFARTPNRSELTPAGRAVHHELSGAFASVERVLAEIGARRDPLVLACPPGLAQQWLVPRIDQLQRALGPDDLRLWIFDRDAELDSAPWDVAIRMGEAPDEHHDSVMLFPEEVVPVASVAVAARLGLGRGSTAAELLDAPLLHMDDGDRPWISWSQWFARFGVEIARQPGRVLFHNYPMVLQSAIAGRGVALGWRYLIDDLIDSGVLVPVGPAVRSSRGYHVIWPAGTGTPTVAALVAFLVAQTDSSGSDAAPFRTMAP